MGTGAKEFFVAADGHREAALHLDAFQTRPDGSNSSVVLALYNVLGFSLELYLKAFLATEGMVEDELSRRPYGHNLQNLFDAAVERGFDVYNPRVAEIVKIIGPAHGAYVYRYMEAGGSLQS